MSGNDYCERCHSTGWAPCVVNWRGIHTTAVRECACPSGRRITIDWKGVFRTPTIFVRASGFAETVCPACREVHVRTSAGCSASKPPRNPIPVPKSREAVVTYVECPPAPQDRAAGVEKDEEPAF